MNDFESYLQQKNIIPSTIKRHIREVEKYNKWLKQYKSKLAEQADKKDLLAYLKYLKECRQLANATQNQMLNILKNYYAHLALNYDIVNITHFVKIHGITSKQLYHVFNPDELEQLTEIYYHHNRNYVPNAKELRFYPNHEKLLQARYIALTLVVYQALNTREIIQLTKSNFDLIKATIHVPKSLKSAERTIPLHATQIGILWQFFDQSQSQIIPNKNQLEHLNKTLKTLEPKYNDLLQLRYCKIVHWVKLYGLRKAQYLAGHRNIATTEKYIAGDIETLQNDMDNFHPFK